MRKRTWIHCVALALAAAGLSIGASLLACGKSEQGEIQRGLVVDKEVNMPENTNEMQMTEEERRAKANACCLRQRRPDGLGDTDATEKGDQHMTGVGVGAEREQIIRWMEEGRTILEIIVRLLNDADQLKVAADAAQKENERLRYECDQLRREVNQLTADHERSKKERAEIAQWFSSVMSEAASRLLIERPPA